jgi:hypothetical protein
MEVLYRNLAKGPMLRIPRSPTTPKETAVVRKNEENLEILSFDLIKKYKVAANPKPATNIPWSASLK